ncbi:MAG: methyltransferase domain-containing protein [Xanthobacteraceae bacterium]|nr:methyltransferase domain-containing protein [Xanthobacteraceae bacterium]
MDFRKAIRESIGVDQRGVEIGPSYSPILPKADGYRVVVVDHLDQGGLRRKYAPHGVDLSRIEEVDAIDDGSELTELDDTGEGFDFILASHVFEHLPNPIRFLQRCQRALKPNGRLILLIPDRRFCFDFLRPVSTAGQMVEAFFQDRSVHSAAAMFDHHAYHARRSGLGAWAEGDGGDVTLEGEASSGYAAALQSAGDTYVDCHAWVFTPSSFRLIIEDLRLVGLIRLGEVRFESSVGCEFYVELSPSAAENAQDRRALALLAIDEGRKAGV